MPNTYINEVLYNILWYVVQKLFFQDGIWRPSWNMQITAEFVIELKK